MQGKTCSLCKSRPSPPAPQELPKTPSKFAPAPQDNIRTKTASSLSVLIEDFCQYSCFTAKNLHVKHKGLLKPFICVLKKGKTSHLQVKSSPNKLLSSIILQRCYYVKQIIKFPIPLNTSENPSKRIIATFVGGASCLLLGFLNSDQNYSCLSFIF